MWQNFFHVGWQLLSISSSFLRIIVFGRALEAAEVTGRGWGWGRAAEAVRLMMAVSSSFEEEERRKITACQCHILLRTKKPDCYSLLPARRGCSDTPTRPPHFSPVTEWSKIHNPVQKVRYGVWQDFFDVGWQLLSISSLFLRIIVFGCALKAAEVTGRGLGRFWGCLFDDGSQYLV